MRPKQFELTGAYGGLETDRLLTRHHSHEEILPYYRAADFCMVTSLHDGMNLVAKEFVASREDGEGALILSQFTGATRELRDALIVNPYDTDQLAMRFASHSKWTRTNGGRACSACAHRQGKQRLPLGGQSDLGAFRDTHR